jgi:hypothetical protein
VHFALCDVNKNAKDARSTRRDEDKEKKKAAEKMNHGCALFVTHCDRSIRKPQRLNPSQNEKQERKFFISKVST